MILGAALYPVFGIKGILFPLIIHAINLIASIIGVSVVRSSAKPKTPCAHSTAASTSPRSSRSAASRSSSGKMLNGPGVEPGWLFASGVIGLVTAFLFVWITQYYTESRYRPVQLIAESSLTGPATNIISGLAVGMETPALPVIVISMALLGSYYCGVEALADVNSRRHLRLRQGHLRHGGCNDGHAGDRRLHPRHGHLRSHHRQRRRHHRDVPPARRVRENTDKLDSAGNTTKALTKGYAIGSASLAAFLLFSAYLEEVRTIVARQGRRRRA